MRELLYFDILNRSFKFTLFVVAVVSLDLNCSSGVNMFLFPFYRIYCFVEKEGEVEKKTKVIVQNNYILAG